MRKLARIEKVNKVEKLEQFDNLVYVHVGGWRSLVPKNYGLKEGDVIVIFEYDSLIPAEDKRFEFITTIKEGGFRHVKKQKIRGIVSDCVIMPVSLFPELSSYNIGDDVTSVLKIKKYEPQEKFSIGGSKVYPFPSFIPKTDQERIQNLSSYFSDPEILNTNFEVTEKIDGTSCTVYFFDQKVGVCSRNLEIVEGNNNLYLTVANKYGIVDLLRSLSKNIAVQMEIYGKGINKRKTPAEVTYAIYDIYDIDSQKYYTPEETRKFCEEHKLNHVPVIETNFPVLSVYNSIEKLNKYIENLEKENREDGFEGIVCKSVTEHRISFKVINPDYKNS